MAAYPDDACRSEGFSPRDCSKYIISFSVPEFPRIQREGEWTGNGAELEERNQGENRVACEEPRRDEDASKETETKDYDTKGVSEKENTSVQARSGGGRKFLFAQVVRETMLKEKGVSHEPKVMCHVSKVKRCCQKI